MYHDKQTPPFFCDETCVYIYHKIYFLSMYCFAYRWIQQEEIKERERWGKEGFSYVSNFHVQQFIDSF